MKNIMRYALSAFVLTFLFSGFAATSTNAQIVNEVLSRVDQHYKALVSLRADVKREIYNAQLKETDPYSGSLLLLPNKKNSKNLSMRLDWEKPEVETISVLEGKFIAYKPSTNQAYTGNSNSSKVKTGGGGVLGMMSMSKADIKANYKPTYIGQETVAGGVLTWHLVLTPTGKADFKFADVWIDGNGMPIQAKVTLPNNDTDTIVFSRIRTNETINVAEFKVVLPKGTKVVPA